MKSMLIQYQTEANQIKSNQNKSKSNQIKSDQIWMTKTHFFTAPFFILFVFWHNKFKYVHCFQVNAIFLLHLSGKKLPPVRLHPKDKSLLLTKVVT